MMGMEIRQAGPQVGTRLRSARGRPGFFPEDVEQTTNIYAGCLGSLGHVGYLAHIRDRSYFDVRPDTSRPVDAKALQRPPVGGQLLFPMTGC